MLNQTVLVGKIFKLENKNKIVIAVSNSVKNENGEYDFENIPINISDSIGKNVFEFCDLGGVIGVKGKIKMLEDNITIQAEKVSFLSSKRG